MNKPELLAPAGNKEALIAAIDNGADAVYFGSTFFSARQLASNFSNKEIEWAVDYAHVRGKKAYVTVNTLIKDSELEKAGKFLHFLCSTGADAVIVQDAGIMRLLHDKLPELPIHASTQMTIHNIEGVKYLEEMGVKRVVLAREMTLEEIKTIISDTSLEIETFIHGALCFSYSGQCLLSSMIGGRSGNRGYCAQPCRRKYETCGLKGYVLSTRDLNMSEHIGALIDSGITSFKIEGRMKRPEYVAGVVRVYRKLIDRYIESPLDFHVTEDEKHTLLQLFNREFTTGYFFGDQGSRLMSRKYPHNRGTELGEVADYDRRTGMVTILLKARLQINDGIGIGERETGIIVRNIFKGKNDVTEAKEGSSVKIRIDSEVGKGEPVFKTFDSRLMRSLKTSAMKKIPVWMRFKAMIDEPPLLTVDDGENSVTVSGNTAVSARTRPIKKDSITEQLSRLGDTVFAAEKLEIDLDDNIFIPVSELNSIRRNAVKKLEEIRSSKWKRQCNEPVIMFRPGNFKAKPVLSVNTASSSSFIAAVNSGADVIYAGPDFENIYSLIDYAHQKSAKVVIRTPIIEKDIDKGRLNTFPENLIDVADGFLAGNIGMLYHLRKYFPNLPIVGDYHLNVMNSLTLDYLLEACQRLTLSPELTLKEIRNMAGSGPSECIVHGFFPLIVSEHDLIGDFFNEKKPDRIFLKDEKGFEFEARNDAHDRTYIMNSRELCLLEHIPDIINAGVNCLRIEAGSYDARTTADIARKYRTALDNFIHGKDKTEKCRGGHTTGHYYRGVS